MNRMRLAYILSPILPSVLFAAVFGLSETRILAFMLVFSIPLAYIPCFLLGAPYISFLKRKKALSTFNLSLGGVLIGAVVFYVFGLIFSGTLGSPRGVLPSFHELFSGAVLGLLVALLFGVIAGLPFFKKDYE